MQAIGFENRLKKWIIEASEALDINLVHSDTPLDQTVFKPEFTYQIFGDEEKIFGYKNLKIQLYYAAGSLYNYVRISYDSKLGNTEATKSLALTCPPQDIQKLLISYLAPGFTDNMDVFMDQVKKDEGSFTPMGIKVGEYSNEDVVYEIFKCGFQTPRYSDYHQRLKVFLLFFIEGASFIDESDEKWEIYLMFEKSPNKRYSLVGFSSIYPFYYFPQGVRCRISQFLIFPPYQGKGHGSRFYEFLYQVLLSDKNVHQVAVEEASEAFSIMRDKCDLKFLSKQALTKEAPTKTEMAEIGKKYKLSSRQLARCVEMLLYKDLDKKNRQKVRLYRLFVKKRLYHQNKEFLKELTFDERLQKLKETYEAVEEEYREILQSSHNMEAFHFDPTNKEESVYIPEGLMFPYYHPNMEFSVWSGLDFASPFIAHSDFHYNTVSECNSSSCLPQMNDFPPTPQLQSISSSSSLECPSISSKEQRRSSSSCQASGDFNCPFPGCTRTFTRKDNIKYHLKTHDENRVRPYSCSMCDKTYYRAIDLTRHVSVTHYNIKAYKCQLCSQAYTRKEALKRHLERSH